MVSQHNTFEDLTALTGNDYTPDQLVDMDTSDFKYEDIEEFFYQEDGGAEASGKGSTYEQVDSPIKKLKEIVLELDWEITDANMANFAATVGDLQAEWGKDKVAGVLLTMLQSLGSYIDTNKAKAHGDSIKMLYSVYNNLEKILLSTNMQESAKDQILQAELKKFEALKKTISKTMADARKKQTKPPADARDDKRSRILPLKALVLSIDLEISAETLSAFNTELAALETLWGKDKNLQFMLKLLHSVGDYIAKNRKKSHPDSIKLLHSAYNNLERILITAGITAAEKKKIAEQELQKFYKLRQEIAQLKARGAAAEGEEEGHAGRSSAPAEKEVPAPQQEAGPPVSPVEESEDDEKEAEDWDPESADDEIVPAFGHIDMADDEVGSGGQDASGVVGLPDMDDRLDQLFGEDQTETGTVAAYPPADEAVEMEVEDHLDGLFPEESATAWGGEAGSIGEMVAAPEAGTDVLAETEALMDEEEPIAALAMEEFLPAEAGGDEAAGVEEAAEIEAEEPEPVLAMDEGAIADESSQVSGVTAVAGLEELEAFKDAILQQQHDQQERLEALSSTVAGFVGQKELQAFKDAILQQQHGQQERLEVLSSTVVGFVGQEELREFKDAILRQQHDQQERLEALSSSVAGFVGKKELQELNELIVRQQHDQQQSLDALASTLGEQVNGLRTRLDLVACLHLFRIAANDQQIGIPGGKDSLPQLASLQEKIAGLSQLLTASNISAADHALWADVEKVVVAVVEADTVESRPAAETPKEDGTSWLDNGGDEAIESLITADMEAEASSGDDQGESEELPEEQIEKKKGGFWSSLFKKKGK